MYFVKWVVKVHRKNDKPTCDVSHNNIARIVVAVRLRTDTAEHANNCTGVMCVPGLLQVHRCTPE